MSDTAAKGTTKGTRCVALVGLQSSGKTTLIESMLLAAGAIKTRSRTVSCSDLAQNYFVWRNCLGRPVRAQLPALYA